MSWPAFEVRTLPPVLIAVWTCLSRRARLPWRRARGTPFAALQRPSGARRPFGGSLARADAISRLLLGVVSCEATADVGSPCPERHPARRVDCRAPGRGNAADIFSWASLAIAAVAVLRREELCDAAESPGGSGAISESGGAPGSRRAARTHAATAGQEGLADSDDVSGFSTCSAPSSGTSRASAQRVGTSGVNARRVRDAVRAGQDGRRTSVGAWVTKRRRHPSSD